MKLRTKIIAGFLIVAVVGWLVGITGLISIQQISSLTKDQDLIRRAYVDASEVLDAHYEWRQALTEAVYSGQRFEGSTDPATCSLGQWISSESSKINSKEVESILDEIIGPHNFMHEGAQEINDLIAKGQEERALSLFIDEILPKTDVTVFLINEIEEHVEVLLQEKADGISKAQALANRIIVTFLLVGIVASVLLAVFIIKSIMRPIREITESAEILSKGHLEVEVDYEIDDEIGHLKNSFINLSHAMKIQADILEALSQSDYTSSIDIRSEEDTVNKAINRVISATNETLNTINVAAEQVSTAAGQVSSGAQALASGSTEQAATIQELNASIVEIANQAEENSVRVQAVTKQLENAGTRLNDGNLHMQQLGDAMKEIHTASLEVSSIAGVIENIAFQTNILALNAAVEAARAGSAGKGFAVVADEVRNLAAKSAEAAKETSRLLEVSAATVNNGLTMTQETAQILGEVSADTVVIIDGVTHIDNASVHQARAIEQVKEGLNQVSSVVQTNAATSEQNSAASEEMSAQADLLRSEIRKFKLKDSIVLTSKDHILPASQFPSEGISLNEPLDIGKY
jgi:methyl-accepting chemotaxis protein